MWTNTLTLYISREHSGFEVLTSLINFTVTSHIFTDRVNNFMDNLHNFTYKIFYPIFDKSLFFSMKRSIKMNDNKW